MHTLLILIGLVTVVGGSTAEYNPPVLFGFQYGSMFSETTRFIVHVETNVTRGARHDDNRRIPVLFNTGESESWVEVGGVHPVKGRAAHHFVPAPQFIRPAATLFGGRTLNITWTVRHEHPDTYGHGVGQLAAGPGSTFARGVPRFTIYPLGDRNKTFALIMGEKDESRPWTTVPVVDRRGWVLHAAVSLGGPATDMLVRINSGQAGIGLPAPMYHHLVRIISEHGGEVHALQYVIVVEGAEFTRALPDLYIRFGEFEVILPFQCEPKGTAKCMMRVHQHDHDFIDLGASFLQRTYVHLDAVSSTVSFGGL